MHCLVRHKTFQKDFLKLKMTDVQYTKFILYIGKLLNEEDLPSEARDHKLKGNWDGFKEFHVGGDLLVVYRLEKDTLYLIRIGTHSQLFK
jgi:mRNA interferase YafQ